MVDRNQAQDVAEGHDRDVQKEPPSAAQAQIGRYTIGSSPAISNLQISVRHYTTCAATCNLAKGWHLAV